MAESMDFEPSESHLSNGEAWQPFWKSIVYEYPVWSSGSCYRVWAPEEESLNNPWRDMTVLFRYCVFYSVYWFPLFSILLHFYSILLFSYDYRAGFFHYVPIITLSDLLLIKLRGFYQKRKNNLLLHLESSIQFEESSATFSLLSNIPCNGISKKHRGPLVLGIVVPDQLCARRQTAACVSPVREVWCCAAHTSYLKLERIGCSSVLSSPWYPKFWINIW